MADTRMLTSVAGVTDSANGSPATPSGVPIALCDASGPAECVSHSARWFVGKHKPFEGSGTVERLRSAGFPAHAPCLRERKPRRDDVLRPLFPGYLLVQFDLAQPNWGAVLDARIGLVGLLASSATCMPVPLPQGFVEELMANANEDDVVADPRLMGKVAPKLVGRQFRVENGPWTSFIGKCISEDRDRLRLMMELFGRLVPTEFRREQLEDLTAGGGYSDQGRRQRR